MHHLPSPQYTLASLLNTNGYVIIHGDNTSIVKGWWKHRYRNIKVNGVFCRINEFIQNLPYNFDISHHMSQVLPIQQMNLLEGYMDQQAFFSPQPIFQQSLSLSSSTPQNHSQPQRYNCCIMGVTLLQQPSLLTGSSSGSRKMNGLKLVEMKRKLSSVEHSMRNEKKSTWFNVPLPNTNKNTASAS